MNWSSLISKHQPRGAGQCWIWYTELPVKFLYLIQSAGASLPWMISGTQIGTQKKWEVYTHGGRYPTGIDAVGWAVKAEKLGAGEILLTSMDRDGTKDGYDIPLTLAIARAVRIPVIASGGVGTLEHLVQGLVESEADAVLAASIFHFGEYSIIQAKEYLREKGVPVRI